MYAYILHRDNTLFYCHYYCYFTLNNFRVNVHRWASMCHSTRGAVRGQLVGVESLLPLCVSWALSSGH